MKHLTGVVQPQTAIALKSFFRTGAPTFRIFLDVTCTLPEDWKQLWAAPPIDPRADPTRAKQDLAWWWMKYGAAGFVPHMLSVSPFVTKDWQSANASLVVFFAQHSTGMPSITQQQCLDRLRLGSEAFRATGGARHFFILTGDNGPCCIDGRYKDVDFLGFRIIGNHGQYGIEHQLDRWGIAPPIPCFDSRKDISIPAPAVHYPALPRAAVQPRAFGRGEERPLLIFHAGVNKYSACRRRLLELFEHHSATDVRVARALPRNETAMLMLRARFCPVCSGFAPWTGRLPEVMQAGCVPIIIEERWKLPFGELLDYASFSASLPLDRLDSLVSYARTLDYGRLQRGVLKARRAMRYDLSEVPTGGDMLPLLVFEMWRRLQLPVPDSSYIRQANSKRTENAPGSSHASIMGAPTRFFADSMLVLNQSHAFLNQTRYRCWTHGYTCECARADLHAMNRRMRWPPYPDRLGGEAVRAMQAAWLREHVPWAVAPMRTWTRPGRMDR